MTPTWCLLWCLVLLLLSPVLPYSSAAKRLWECKIWGNQASAKGTSGAVIGLGRDSLWTGVQWHLSLTPQMEMERWSMSSSKMERREYVKETGNKTNHHTEISCVHLCLQLKDRWTSYPFRRKSESVNSHCAIKGLTLQNLTVCWVLIIFCSCFIKISPWSLIFFIFSELIYCSTWINIQQVTLKLVVQPGLKIAVLFASVSSPVCRWK